ncbi:hypothetical protein HanLR1_Chr00c0203g0727771 [Helianthus annuus]|nr:hypothetical protein HanLR1_Chr00c0203g0727771 [Helianthus annuus]
MASLTTALKTLFSLLACVMSVSLVYAFATDYFLSCFDPKARSSWSFLRFQDKRSLSFEPSPLSLSI